MTERGAEETLKQYYLRCQREANTLNETWRQHYTRLNGGVEPEWFKSPSYYGLWLDVVMGEEDIGR